MPKADLLNPSNYSTLIGSTAQNQNKINQSGQQNKTIGLRAAILPTVIFSNNSINYLNPNGNLGQDGAQFKLTGKEKFVNSGFIWPQGQVPKGFANVTSFNVKFKQEGTYHFQCLIHPEMKGTVTVTPPNTTRLICSLIQGNNKDTLPIIQECLP